MYGMANTKENRLKARAYYIPANAVETQYKELDTVVYTYTNSNNKPGAVAFIGTSSKLFLNYLYQSEKSRTERLAEFIAGRTRNVDYKTKRKEENKGLLTGSAATAKCIKSRLKLEFPEIKFSVTSDTYSMGNSVHISWVDGPLSKMVEAITNQYQYGRFDGMTDSSYSVDIDKSLGCDGAKHISCSRKQSDELKALLENACIEKYGCIPEWYDNFGFNFWKFENDNPELNSYHKVNVIDQVEVLSEEPEISEKIEIIETQIETEIEPIITNNIIELSQYRNEGLPVINESLAKRAKENMSFSDYRAGSATAEFIQVIAEAQEKIDHAKLNASEESKERLDAAFNRYKYQYANWINKYNSNGAGHVSVMIAGPSNYDMRKHEKYLNREGKLFEEFRNIDIDSDISKILNGDKIIKSDDANALDKLKDKLAKAIEEHEGYKAHNVNARKEGKPSLAAYVLQNSNQRIKNIKDRISHIEKQKSQDSAETIVNGIKIIDNVEANRVQIIFDGKPSQEIRNALKSRGFKWAPSNIAWQRFRSQEALRIANQIAASL